MIKICKLVSGDMVIGDYNKENKKLEEVYAFSFMPNGQGGISITLAPFSSPLSRGGKDSIDGKFIMFEYPMDEEPAQELIQHYIQLKSGIELVKVIPNKDPYKN